MTLEYQDIKASLMDLIHQNSANDSIETNDATNIVTAAGLDSFALLNFIMDVELEFEVELSTDDLSDEANQTVGGLASLLAKRKSTQTD